MKPYLLLAEQPIPCNNQDRWTNIVTATTNAARKILGVKDKLHRHNNPYQILIRPTKTH